jgi:hypothetical protein
MLLAAGMLTLAACAPGVVWAQWPPYPTPRVPRTADGAPNLAAPAPRTDEGKPDLTGIWENDRPAGERPAGAPPPGGFRNIGAGFTDGLPLRPWAADVLARRKADNSKDNPDAHCLPMGIIQFNTHPFPRKMIQTPDVLIILYEANSWVRQILTDGRGLPDNDPTPWWNGYSIGRWDGDTLVVETTGFKDGGWLDIDGSPLTDAATITERFRRPDFGHLEIEVTIDDPKAYTRPWTVMLNQRIMLDTEIIEFVCNENEKSTQYFDK